MVVIAKEFVKKRHVSTRRQLTYEEFVESDKQYKFEKAKLQPKRDKPVCT